MSWQRKTIRREFVRLLLAAETDAGSRVAQNRPNPVWQSSLPYLVVTTSGGEPRIEHFGDAPRRYTRSLMVEVEGFVGDTDESSASVPDQRPFHDRADDLADEVERAILPFLSMDCVDHQGIRGPCGEPLEINWPRSTLVRVETGETHTGETLNGAFRTTFEVAYVTSVSEGDVDALDDFETAGVEWQTEDGPGSEIEAEDEIELPQG